ncbi:DnaB-like helicase N terminal domain-containing protein [Rhodococcoides kroppenstedtii]|uniref:DnaB-like helicase N terminal domain-containing protein n=1 Tax=Rhodococcoides kroppenstedtii TaxID=293050 RepID=A0A1I0SZW4_9NOCA|nr:DnaB-like helicase N-terminal domain-containing protein [Rhodococcus kroppenstedtii]SFA45049.1 DnaB-like helicase N terminal domain-containing protein [Rhodococcus kroppenstedtii]
MNALRAVPTEGPDDDAAGHDAAVLDLAPDTAPVAAPAGDPTAQELDELDPRTDPESLTLCALMWSAESADTTRVAAALTPGDFASPAHAELFTIIAALITENRPHDPASVAAVIHRAGGGQKDAPLRRVLADVVTADAPAVAAVHYADIVLSQSYRRSFHIAGQRITQAAEQGPEDELFDYMVQLGRQQRAAWNRLNTFRSGTVAEGEGERS